MKYQVVSGEFRTTVESSSPREAAQDALNLWRLKVKKPILSKILTVVKPDNKEVYLNTSDLLSE